MRKHYIALAIMTGLTLQSFAEPVVPRGDFTKKLKKVAGEPGQFYFGKEVFPKDYFLIPRNLPFLAGLSLHHPKSSTLKLSKEQIEGIQKIKKTTVPPVLKMTKKVKELELKLAQNIAIDTSKAEDQFGLVDEIAKIRTDLTKAHLKCINEVRAILTKEQYKKLLKYATNMKHKPKSNKFKVDELVFLPHPGKFIKKGIIDLNKDQKEKLSKIKSTLVPKFQGKLREAFDVENKLRRKVAKGATAIEVKGLLDQIEKLKRESIDIRIGALDKIRQLLTQEQWKKVNKLTYK